MCSSACLGSDELHIEGMELSSCDCIELSPQPEDISFRVKGQFCLENTGRLLCEYFGSCGVWNCRLGDFSCPRFEYNKQKIDYRNMGSCKSNAFSSFFHHHYMNKSYGSIVPSSIAILMDMFYTLTSSSLGLGFLLLLSSTIYTILHL